MIDLITIVSINLNEAPIHRIFLPQGGWSLQPTSGTLDRFTSAHSSPRNTVERGAQTKVSLKCQRCVVETGFIEVEKYPAYNGLIQDN